MNTSFSPKLPQAGSTSGRKLWIGIGLGVLASFMLMCGLLLLGFNFLRPRLSAEARFVEVSAACTKLYEESKFDEAIEACSEAIALKPNSIDAYITRGYIALTRRQYDKALADFDQALHYDPNNGQAFINRGITYARMGDIDKTIANYDEMLSRDIQNSTHRYYGYNNRGLAYDNKGDVDHAIQDYVHAIQEQTSLLDAYDNLEGIFLREKSQSELIDTYNGLVQQYPENPEILFRRGTIYRRMGQFDHAMEDFEESLTLHPSDQLKSKIHTQIHDIKPLVEQ